LKVERTLILIKPDAVERNLTGTLISRFEGLELKLVALRMLQLDKELARRHYAVHRDKPFFDRLVDYITSGPIVAMVFEGDNAVEVLRKAMGATDPAKAEASTIRADFGLDIERNTVHGSDSAKTAEEEIKLYFAENEIVSY